MQVGDKLPQVTLFEHDNETEVQLLDVFKVRLVPLHFVKQSRRVTFT